jgi:Flp pilus assembly protein TadD
MNRNQRRAEKKHVRAATAQPSADVLTAQALACLRQGDLAGATNGFRRVVELYPTVASAHNNFGNILREQDQSDAALVCYRRAIALQPAFPEALNNLGTVLAQQGELAAAVEYYRRAIVLRPHYAVALNNLGNVYHKLGEFLAATACSREALRLDPNFADAYNSLGTALAVQGSLQEAADSYRRAIGLQPHFPQAHFNLSNVLLAHGDFEAGWPEYEWRWQTPHMVKAQRHFAQPQWRGEVGSGQTLLIHAEQGFGDSLQFCRYAALAAGRGLRVILEVQAPLVRLLGCLPGVADIIAQGSPLPPFDLHCPMLSLPFAFQTRLDSIPAGTPYLQADPAGARIWRDKLAGPGGLRIGIAWAGSATLAADRRRSLQAAQLGPLVAAAGETRVFSLQKGAAALPAGLPIIDHMDAMADFADTAAFVANLDLVISVDTAMAHLAGALGRPVWLLDRFDPDWRWLLGRADSPWYPTMRIFRQPAAGDWDSVLAAAAAALRDFNRSAP